MRMNKKGALELSINAIVIVILAMTLLGLGLGFVRNMFQDIGGTTTQVQQQVREQILEDLRTGDKKLSFPSSQVSLEAGNEDILAIGVKNVDARDIQFQIQFQEITKDESDQTASIPIASNVKGEGSKYTFFWDDTHQLLGPGESNVYPITLDSDRTATGTKLFKIRIAEINPDTGEEVVEYTSKTFFVRFI